MLKRILLPVLGLITNIIPAPGQNHTFQPEISLGVHGGYGFSKINFYPTVDQNYFEGLNSGLVFKYIGEKNLGIQTELNYIQKGWTEKGNVYSRELNYIELPFMTHIYMGKTVRFFINLGPEISYLLSEKVKTNNTSDVEPQHSQVVQHPFDYGLCGGLGLSFKINRQVFQIDTRFQYSFSDIFSNAQKNYFDNSKNMGLSAGIAWMIQFDKSMTKKKFQ